MPTLPYLLNCLWSALEFCPIFQNRMPKNILTIRYYKFITNCKLKLAKVCRMIQTKLSISKA